MATAVKKRITAAQILQRTITDFTKHPEHWTQNDFARDWTKDPSTAAIEVFNVQREAAVKNAPQVTEPGNGKYDSFGVYGFDPVDLMGEPERVCGLGGIAQAAWKLNKAHFWDADFQRELAWVGAYLNWRAKHWSHVNEYVVSDFNPLTRMWERISQTEEVHYDNYIDFNDSGHTDVDRVIALFKEALVYLKKRDKVNAKKR